MALIEYSDSEESDKEAAPQILRATASSSVKPLTNKTGFQKFVAGDSNKILVNLSVDVNTNGSKVVEGQERPAKRARIGGGLSGDFNAMLPAPKRTGTSSGMARGVELKTGATPGFSRDLAALSNPPSATLDPAIALHSPVESTEHAHTKTAEDAGVPSQPETQKSIEIKSKATIFKPLSVTRKPTKKKNSQVIVTQVSHERQVTNGSTKSVALFSANSIDDNKMDDLNVHEYQEYKPLIYKPVDLSTLYRPDIPLRRPEIEEDASAVSSQTGNDRDAPQTLDEVATTLNLSASAKRQLLGRNAINAASRSAITVTSFNTDDEYAANEALRQAGETVQHAPVRGIAPGKHSLKQLVSVASTQKDALEESFAEGRRNKKAAGSKYGW